MKNMIVLSGAGMSAESGISTFRDADGLWEGHDVMEVASPQGWSRNMDLVLDFYNQRRKQLLTVEPNEGHISLVKLEESYKVDIVTQNVDDLHERAGSSHVIHLHGELRKVRSTENYHEVIDWDNDLLRGDTCSKGYQLRPHIVWFGEDVPMIEHAIKLMTEADVVIIVGTSMQVYPAASLIAYAPSHCDVYYVDPRPTINHELAQSSRLSIIEETAAIGLPRLVAELMQ